ncbi:hypothetical protein SDC9_91253 [bioreactor metagenome]|uniref:Uncharacterized protein n=1 Tax=bioreactor metagenome TaxID=1076179 RepID=A0A645A464_9ZZZZ
MALLDKVKRRLGISYSDPEKNKEINDMIDEARQFFKGAGWDIETTPNQSAAAGAVILYCKMAQSTDPAQLIHHPVMVAFIVQGRAADGA